MSINNILKQESCQTQMSRVIGIDMGAARVGIAISDPSRSLASGYGFLQFTSYKVLVENLMTIAGKEGVGEFVIGLPLNMNGSKGFMTNKAEKLAETLKEQTKHPINFMDERLTTVEAARQIHASGRKVKKGRIDEVAATIILQAFLDGKKR